MDHTEEIWHKCFQGINDICTQLKDCPQSTSNKIRHKQQHFKACVGYSSYIDLLDAFCSVISDNAVISTYRTFMGYSFIQNVIYYRSFDD